MTELIIGLLGGGALVKLIEILLNARPNRRRLTAQALDTEIATLEHTLKIVGENVESEARRHAAERQLLKDEITSLRRRVDELSESVANLRGENIMLRSMLNLSPDAPPMQSQVPQA